MSQEAHDLFTEIESIFFAIAQERLYQNNKYGTPDDRSLSVGDYLTILDVELTEAKQAFARNQDTDAALLEILQVAAVAVACLERHGVVERGQ